MTREEIIDKIHDFLLTHHANVECDTCINVFEDLRSLIDEIKTDKYPESPWHSVADGDFPMETKGDYADMPFIVVFKDGIRCSAYYDFKEDEENAYFYDDCDCALDVEYWMEIPELPTELK